MDKNDQYSFSPEKKKINYYEQNPKLLKKEKQRQSLGHHQINAYDENINNENMKLNFQDNIKINPGILDLQSNFSVSQPINMNNIPNDNFCMNNILDDFLNELENEENEKNKNYYDEERPITNELKGLFERSKYHAYFKTSRTQNSQFSNVWDDFHQKRDKL